MARASEEPPDVQDAIRNVTGYSRIPKQHYVGPPTSYAHLLKKTQREQLEDYTGVDPFRGFGNAVPTDKQFVALTEYWQSSYISYQEELKNRGWEYDNLGSDEGWDDKRAARIEDFPTSTTNPRRPRTVAAGWSGRSNRDSSGKLTVVFRDGTYYNYYNVSYREWQDFRYSMSKGKYIASILDSKPRGPADMTNMDARVRAAIELLYVTARTAQKWRYRPGTKGKFRNRRKPNWHNTSASRQKTPSSKSSSGTSRPKIRRASVP